MTAPIPTSDRLLSIDETATVLSVSRRTVYRLLDTDQLDSVKAGPSRGARRLVPASSLREFGRIRGVELPHWLRAGEGAHLSGPAIARVRDELEALRERIEDVLAELASAGGAS